MPLDRHFLGWQQPALPAAADRLVAAADAGGAIDLSNLTVVTPGGRAGRRLIELLLERAEALGRPLLPPRTATAEALAERLTPAAPLASAAERELAWCRALRSLERDRLAHLAPAPPADDDHASWAALATTVERLHVELAGECIAFADVPVRAAALLDDVEARRWVTLDAVRSGYLQGLDDADRVDPQAHRLASIERKVCRADGPLLLLGMADFNRQLCELLAVAAESVDVRCWVFAPQAMAERFDEWGRILTDPWAEVVIDIDRRRTAVVARPIDQANEALCRITDLNGKYAADQITVALADDQVAGPLRQQFGAFDVPVRLAAGRPIEQTPPARLLAAVAEFVDGARFDAFAALLRHPDIGAWLATAETADGQPVGAEAIDSWLTLLDRYHNDHFQGRLTDDWLGRDSVRQPLRRVWLALHDGAMLGSMAGTRRLGQWVGPIELLLRTVYGVRPLHRHDPSDRLTIAACELLARALDDLRRIAASLDEAVRPSTALRMVLRLVAGQAVPPEADPRAIEALGWLEMPLDDAPVAIVTGVNEGSLPSSVGAAPFMPDSLRRELGITDNARRYARDAYALSAVLACRDQATLIAGRISSEGDPLTPSRLLLTGDDASLAQRVTEWFGDEPVDVPLQSPPGWRAADRSAFTPPPERCIVLPGPPDYMRVTDFALYLDDPYKYALARGRNLKAIDDVSRELDGGAFGSLAHAVLDRFAATAQAESSDADEVSAALDRLLNEQADQRFADRSLPAVRLQIEQLRMRLEWFAQWQASHASQGWRIAASELSFGRRRPASLIVDGEPMALHGKIDRVDHHPDTGAWAVYDYKTSATAMTPDKVHRTGRGDDRRWIDLQLPLYRKLLSDWVDGDGATRMDAASLDDVMLGYIALPRERPSEWGDMALMAGWSADDLAQADDVAAGVVRAVRQGRFEFDPQRRTTWYDLALLVGRDQFVDAASEEGGDA